VSVRSTRQKQLLGAFLNRMGDLLLHRREHRDPCTVAKVPSASLTAVLQQSEEQHEAIIGLLGAARFFTGYNLFVSFATKIIDSRTMTSAIRHTVSTVLIASSSREQNNRENGQDGPG